MLAFLGAFGFIALMLIGAILNGFVLCKLWIWFIVPTFGLPTLTIPVALGISLMASYLTSRPDTNQDDKTDWGMLLAMSLIYPLLVLLFGWFYTLFM